MIYKVTLIQEDSDTALDSIHVRANSIDQAIARARAYADLNWETRNRIGSVEETDIVIVDNDDGLEKV